MNQILFVINNKTELATFNSTTDWRAAPLAPLSNSVSRGVQAGLVLPKFGSSDF